MRKESSDDGFWAGAFFCAVYLGLVASIVGGPCAEMRTEAACEERGYIKTTYSVIPCGPVINMRDHAIKEATGAGLGGLEER